MYCLMWVVGTALGVSETAGPFNHWDLSWALNWIRATLPISVSSAAVRHVLRWQMKQQIRYYTATFPSCFLLLFSPFGSSMGCYIWVSGSFWTTLHVVNGWGPSFLLAYGMPDEPTMELHTDTKHLSHTQYIQDTDGHYPGTEKTELETSGTDK